MIKKIIVIVAGLLLALFLVLRWSYAGAVSSIETTQNVVALTYDDGPNPPDTQALLELLNAYGVTATFFLKGRNVAAYPDAARAIVAAGHEVANHSYDHLPMSSLSEADMRAEITRAATTLRTVLGVESALFRPPFGVQFVGTRRALDTLGLTSILMSAHGADWERTDAQEVADAVLADVSPGGIILLHDGHGDVADPSAQASRQHSVAATEIIIRALREKGYQFVTVSQLLAMSKKSE